jgi:hypothetical protein
MTSGGGDGEREEEAIGEGAEGGMREARKVWKTSWICEASSLVLSTRLLRSMRKRG